MATHKRGEILKLDDSCISNPEIRNLKLDLPALKMVSDCRTRPWFPPYFTCARMRGHRPRLQIPVRFGHEFIGTAKTAPVRQSETIFRASPSNLRFRISGF